MKTERVKKANSMKLKRVKELSYSDMKSLVAGNELMCTCTCDKQAAAKHQSSYER